MLSSPAQVPTSNLVATLVSSWPLLYCCSFSTMQSHPGENTSGMAPLLEILRWLHFTQTLKLPTVLLSGLLHRLLSYYSLGLVIPVSGMDVSLLYTTLDLHMAISFISPPGLLYPKKRLATVFMTCQPSTSVHTLLHYFIIRVYEAAGEWPCQTQSWPKS